MDRKERAVEFKHNAHNCCQAVLLAFAEELKMSADKLNALGAAFGAGTGNMEATCGALVGAEMALGMKQFQGKPILGAAAQLHKEFFDLCGASVCKDLKGRDTGVVICPCDDCVRNAVLVAEKMILQGA